MEYILPNGQIITFNEGACFTVACWNADGTNHWLKEFNDKEKALKEYERFRPVQS